MILIWNNFSSIAQSFEFISMAQVQKKKGLRPLTAGQDSDIIQAPALIEGLDPDMVIADKAYDANDFIQMIQGMGAMVVIPVRSNRNQQREYDHHWYKDPNLVERFFNKIKQFRRIATRYEKLDRNFMSMLNLVCTIIWLA
jgi:transposase